MRRKRLSKRRRRWPVWLLGGIVLAGMAIGAAFAFDRPNHANPYEWETVKVDGISMPARTGERYLQAYRDGAWQDMLIKGVNMGVANPGHFPG
ncbi:MAG: hypothetical protein K0R28_7032, partial [Paenibacillus sp.]|nr:hypothetical protein [Paenibacillus sp.]